MKSFGIPEDIHRYVVERSNPSSDPVSVTLAATTSERFGGRAAMNIGDEVQSVTVNVPHTFGHLSVESIHRNPAER